MNDSSANNIGQPQNEIVNKIHLSNPNVLTFGGKYTGVLLKKEISSKQINT
jgi:hypothetical protein